MDREGMGIPGLWAIGHEKEEARRRGKSPRVALAGATWTPADDVCCSRHLWNCFWKLSARFPVRFRAEMVRVIFFVFQVPGNTSFTKKNPVRSSARLKRRADDACGDHVTLLRRAKLDSRAVLM